MTIFSWLEKQWRQPTFSTLLEYRKIVFILLAIVVIHIVSTGMDFGLWSCPVKTTLGVKCPGCGLSHAIIYMLRGEWSSALKEHVFAPLFVLGFLFAALMVLLPVQRYQKINHRIKLLEEKTGFFNVIMVVLVVYWIIRMFIKA